MSHYDEHRITLMTRAILEYLYHASWGALLAYAAGAAIYEIWRAVVVIWHISELLGVLLWVIVHAA